MKRISFMLTAFLLLSLAMNAQTKQKVGNKFGGGIVISVSADGLNGVIAETQDQGECDWDAAAALIADPAKHSKEGKAVNNWRLPTRDELKLMYAQKATIGGFSGNYWSSTTGKGRVSTQEFAAGKVTVVAKTDKNKVRAVRNF